ncbi:MAG: hypothetical protein IPK63_09480 [Candidatus Competibacteraceae bacterium]|nr:hypothetical protein [Candidatus Competibacteraceae bacterium]
MTLSQELCNDTLPPFLVDRRSNPMPGHRIELLVEISVLALRDCLLETLLEQATASLQSFGGQRSLLFRQPKNEQPTMYSQGRWRELDLELGCDQSLRATLAALGTRAAVSWLQAEMAESLEVLVLPDDEILLLLPLLQASSGLLVLGVFINHILDEEHHRFLCALGRVLAAALSRQETDAHRQAELAHAGRLLLLGEMTSSLIHELNQPLAAILNYAHGSQRQLEIEALPTAIMYERLDKIATQACRASELVKRLRRLIRKEPINQITAVDLARLLNDTVKLCEADARQQHLQIKLHLPQAPLPEVAGDPIQMEQTLLNLLLNAIEAGPHPTLKSGVITVEANSLGPDCVLVRVRDQGPGLPDDGNIELLFQPFHTTHSEGLGLGLAISRSLVESQGGRLWAERNEEGGATFNLTLPVAKIAGAIS